MLLLNLNELKPRKNRKNLNWVDFVFFGIKFSKTRNVLSNLVVFVPFVVPNLSVFSSIVTNFQIYQ